ncbi:peptide ABC transporter substrate-binding protein [Abyssibius alkaniclasticus]|uniref:peptide ABC transporter substrate-binding protein n=1 Tax=Abyssibius alkaniclasticus TaxID=2881234 RepID=UPI00236484DE|nr:peptide ABC transporter substrate-binding protein [Abyssibius alkaniclasticus]UPH70992.1 peptide ABC transporter substrate-binding protein [Abyssibius alkaniclasticus]|tara:strand:+ start:715 stop:2343 length:1629 start_codon:yes stop_codon:yes gene_type:complete
MTLSFKSLTAMLAATTMLAGPVLAAGTHPETGEPLSDNQTFTYRILDEFSAVDPGIAEDVSGAEVIRDLFEGLMNQDENGNLVPGVATGYTTNDAKNVYTFTLRPEAMWSNGTPVTANDFVYAWRRAADPATASPYAWYIELMSIENAAAVIAGEMPTDALGVTAIDDYTLEVRLSGSLPYFPLMTTHTTTFPVPQAVVEEFGADWTKPENIVSNGAYVLTEHIPQERSVRERNPMYWNNDATIIEKVVALVINDDDTALTRWKAGELDRTEIPTGQYPSLNEEYPGEALAFPRLCNYYYTFNLSEDGPEAFKDVRVRQALSYAVDRSIITDQVLQGGQVAAFTFTPGATANFSVPDVAFGQMTQAERNAAAVELLAEAGYGPDNPLAFELVYNTSEAHAQIATVVAQMWKQTLGVEVTQNNMEWQVFLEERGSQRFEMARGAWCGDYNEASTFLDLLNSSSGYNDGKYSNPEVDALLAAAKTMDDPSANYTQIEEILANDMPVIPVYHYSGNMMLNDEIRNWPINNVEQNWYSRNLYRVDN